MIFTFSDDESITRDRRLRSDEEEVSFLRLMGIFPGTFKNSGFKGNKHHLYVCYLCMYIMYVYFYVCMHI